MHSQNEIQLNLRVPLKLFNTITMPKDKEMKVVKNANYAVMLTLDYAPGHYKNGSNNFAGHFYYIMIISYLVGHGITLHILVYFMPT